MSLVSDSKDANRINTSVPLNVVQKWKAGMVVLEQSAIRERIDSTSDCPDRCYLLHPEPMPGCNFAFDQTASVVDDDPSRYWIEYKR